MQPESLSDEKMAVFMVGIAVMFILVAFVISYFVSLGIIKRREY